MLNLRHALDFCEMPPRVLLLLPTSTYRTHDFMAAAARQGVLVVVASEEPSTMEHLAGDSLLTLHFGDPKGSAEKVAAFHEKHPLRAVIAVDEETAVVASVIGERLGFPRNAPEAAERARLKHVMREALAAAGVPAPAHRVFTTDDDPRAAALGVRYPAVIKPVFLSGSRGVQRVDDEDAFVRAFEWTRELLARPELAKRGGGHARTVLVEDFVFGPEVALEAILTDGELTTLALFDKPDPLDGPYFEETIYVTPSRLPAETQAKIANVTAQAAAALDLRHGPIHAELRLPPGKSPSVLEIAGRSIGGLCSRTLRFGLGLSLEELILKHALGEDVTTEKRESKAAGVMMIPIPKKGELTKIEGLEDAKAVEGIEEVTITVHRGAYLIPLPEGSTYLGFIFAKAETPEKVEQALRKAHKALTFQIETR